MNVKINFKKNEFELALKELAAQGLFPPTASSSTTCISVVGIVAQYCLHEPISSRDPSIVRVHLPALLSHPRVRQELCDTLFARCEPTYDDLASIAKLIIQVAYQRLLMSQAKSSTSVFHPVS